MKKEMVGDVPGSVLGMLADLNLKLRDGALMPEELDRFLQRQDPFLQPTSLVAEWRDFYHFLGLEADFSNLRVPEKRRGFDRLIVMAQGTTVQWAYEKCAESFPCWKYTDKSLDEVVSHNDRSPQNGAYAIWVRDRVEADEEHKNKSANELKEKNIPGITLPERLIYERKYFKETRNHLDIQNLTLCTGSRYSDGYVPDVHWHLGKLGVDWYDPVRSFDFLRSRETVS